jgi:hypothetical protein
MGPPTWGTGGSPGVTIGQMCMSVTREAGGIGSDSLPKGSINHHQGASHNRLARRRQLRSRVALCRELSFRSEPDISRIQTSAAVRRYSDALCGAVSV